MKIDYSKPEDCDSDYIMNLIKKDDLEEIEKFKFLPFDELFELIRSGVEKQDERLLECAVRKSYYLDELSWCDLVNRALMQNQVNMVRYIYTIQKDKFDFNNLANSAALSGNCQLLAWALDRGANELESYASSAASGKHFDALNLLVAKGAKDFDDVAFSGIYNEHLEVLDWAIEKGASDFNKILELAEFLQVTKRFEDALGYLIKKGNKQAWAWAKSHPKYRLKKL